MNDIDLIARYESAIVGLSESRSKQRKGAIAKMPDGTYQARCISGHDENGQPEHKDIYGKSRLEVKEKLIKAVFIDVLEGGGVNG